MPNPWGANLGGFPPFNVAVGGGSPVACPAGVETDIITVTGVVSQQPGTFSPAWIGALNITLGATPPTGLTINGRINDGADFAQQIIPGQMLVANAQMLLPIFLFNAPKSGTLWLPPGANLQLSVTPTGNAATAQAAGSSMCYWLMRVGE